MTEQELKDIGAGLKRWHSMSTETGQKLLDEIYRLRHHIAMENLHLDILYKERDDALRTVEELSPHNTKEIDNA
jgi:hypothetical protein